MENSDILKDLIAFKKLAQIDSRYQHLDAVLLTFLDRVKKAPKGKRSLARKLIFRVLFYPLSIFMSGLLFAENILRLAFTQKRENKELSNSLLVSFGKSHTLALQKIPFMIKGRTYTTISSRGFKQVLKKANSEEQYIDSSHNLRTTFQILIEHFRHLIALRRSMEYTFRFFSLNVDNKEATKLLFALLQSVRFKVWAYEFTKTCKPELIFLGNDTCYRTYWIINSNPDTKSINIQHGLIENKIMYFSISDVFLCWDTISLNLLWKNPDTEYLVVGYAKLPQYSTSAKIAGVSNDRILLIATKIFNVTRAKKVTELLMAFEVLDIKYDFKIHPLEDSTVISYFGKRATTNHTEDWSFYKHIVVIDSTLAIDLNVIGIPVIPISMEGAGAFSNYYNCLLISDLTNLLLQNKEDKKWDHFLTSRQQIIDLKEVDFIEPLTKFLSNENPSNQQIPLHPRRVR